MHIAGVFVQAVPAQLPQVVAKLGALAGVSVHGTSADGRIVALAEGAERRDVAEALSAINNTAGVLVASMVYEQSDEEPSIDSPNLENTL